MIIALDGRLTAVNPTSTGVRAIDAHTGIGHVPQACLTRAASPGM